jgi:TatD DNase family protein
MTVRFVDTHCHLQLAQYADDRNDIIARMREEGVMAIVVGDDYESSQEAVTLAEKNENLYAAVGVHPSHSAFDSEALLQLAKCPKVVAIGECGLDYYRKSDSETKQAQKELFKKHIALAAGLGKPLAIHARPSAGAHDAYEDLIAILKEAKVTYPNLHGVVHFFVGTLEEAEAFFSLGFMISFTAVITFSHDYDEVIKTVLLENILSETDAPFVAPASRRGERNDPLAVIEVVNQIAAIRGEDPESVRLALLANTKHFFAL